MIYFVRLARQQDLTEDVPSCGRSRIAQCRDLLRDVGRAREFPTISRAHFLLISKELFPTILTLHMLNRIARSRRYSR